MSDLIVLNQAQNILSTIGNKLIENANLMRLLYYDSSDALTLSEVSFDNIIEMAGYGEIDKKRIYKYPFYSLIESTAKSEIRFFLDKIKPENIYLAHLPIYFQVIVHCSLVDLDSNLQRPLEMLKEVLNTLNNESVGGIGKLQLRDMIRMYSYSENFAGYEFCLHTRST